MPRNRPDQDRDSKREAIVAAATELFATDGFDRTSVASVAARAEITKNTVYWYFEDKDALLIAAISHALRRATVAWEDAVDAPLAETLLSIAATFDAISGLTATLHARVEQSPAVREWHEGFHRRSDAWLADAIAQHLERAALPPAPAALISATVRLWTYAIEGMVADDLAIDERRALCRQLVGQLEASAREAPLATRGVGGI